MVILTSEMKNIITIQEKTYVASYSISKFKNRSYLYKEHH